LAGDLEGKVVVLTGGGDGIGRECALAYARAKATVAILDVNIAAARRTAEELGGLGIALHADVSSGPSVASAIDSVVKTLKHIDAVHNNAGIASPSKPLHETDEAEWDNLQRINLKSVYWTTRYAFEALRDSKGTILNTASMVGLIGQQDHAAYVATKGAMISLTKAMAADYARYAGTVVHRTAGSRRDQEIPRRYPHARLLSPRRCHSRRCRVSTFRQGAIHYRLYSARERRSGIGLSQVMPLNALRKAPRQGHWSFMHKQPRLKNAKPTMELVSPAFASVTER